MDPSEAERLPPSPSDPALGQVRRCGAYRAEMLVGLTVRPATTRMTMHLRHRLGDWMQTHASNSESRTGSRMGMFILGSVQMLDNGQTAGHATHLVALTGPACGIR